MKKRKFIFGLLMAAFLISSSITLYSCYPYGSTNPTDYDVILTLHKDDLNSYKTYKKYIMRDSVAHVTDGTGSTVYLKPLDDAIKASVETNLLNYGYQRITSPLPSSTDSADLIISMAITNSTTYYTNTYYPGGYWGYGYGGGYYYPYTTVYSVTTGTVIVNMADKKSYVPGTNPTIVWMGIVNGTADGNTSSSIPRVQTGINTCFSQSPYLKVN